MSNIIKKQLKKHEIMKIAEKYFVDTSYASVSLSMIAKKSGVTKPALYYYFQSKQDIYLEIINEAFTELHKSMDKVIYNQEISTEEKFKKTIITYINFARKRVNFIKLLMQKMSYNHKDVLEIIAGHKDKMIDKLEGLIKEISKVRGTCESVDTRMVTYLFIGMMNSVVGDCALRRECLKWAPEQVADYIIGVIFEKNK